MSLPRSDDATRCDLVAAPGDGTLFLLCYADVVVAQG